MTVLTETTFTPAMLDGHACVLCGADFTVPGCPAHAPVGFIDGRQVFACDDPPQARACALLLTRELPDEDPDELPLRERL